MFVFMCGFTTTSRCLHTGVLQSMIFSDKTSLTLPYVAYFSFTKRNYMKLQKIIRNKTNQTKTKKNTHAKKKHSSPPSIGFSENKASLVG